MTKKVSEVCRQYISKSELRETAEIAVKELTTRSNTVEELNHLKNKMDSLTNHLDKMYMDKPSGILHEADFIHIYVHMKDERTVLREKAAYLGSIKCESAEKQKARINNLV